MAPTQGWRVIAFDFSSRRRCSTSRLSFGRREKSGRLILLLHYLLLLLLPLLVLLLSQLVRTAPPCLDENEAVRAMQRIIKSAEIRAANALALTQH